MKGPVCKALANEIGLVGLLCGAVAVSGTRDDSGGMAVPPTHTLVVRQSNAMVGRLALTRLVTLDCLPLHTTSGNAFSKSPSFGASGIEE